MARGPKEREGRRKENLLPMESLRGQESYSDLRGVVRRARGNGGMVKRERSSKKQTTDI